MNHTSPRSRCSSMMWSSVSKAAVRSSNTSRSLRRELIESSRLIGIGSSSHDFEEDCTMIRLMSSADVGWNTHSSAC